LLDRFDHDIFDLDKPIFDSSFTCDWINDSGERNEFSFDREHSVNFLLFIELKSIDTLETFFEMRLHSQRFLCLRQNFKKLFVGEEEESREKTSLGLKIVIKTFLDSF
jgi:hypothetical protein